MSKDSRTNHFFLYPKQNGHPIGITYCILLRNGRMYHGESFCSPKDQFHKAVGREIALERAQFEAERDEDFREQEAKLEIRHYSDRDKDGALHCIYKVRIQKEEQHPYYIKNIEICPSELDPGWSTPNKVFVKLSSTDTGVQLTTREGTLKLGHDTIHELSLAIKLYQESNNSSKLEQLK